MSADPTPSPAELDGASRWLDGLAGRAGQGPEHDEGAALRQALQPEEQQSPPDWAEVERRADMGDQSDAAASVNVEAPVRSAANSPRWMPWVGVAAALLLVVSGAVLMLPTPPNEGMRGGTSVAQGRDATWRVSDPHEASKALAEELRRLGAQVDWQVEGVSARLTITAQGSAVAGVNSRLAELETALDPSGRLSLHVSAP